MNKSSSYNNQVRMVDVVDMKSQEIFAAEKRRSEVPAMNPYPSSRPRSNGVPVAVPTSSASAHGHSLPVAGQSMGEAAGFPNRPSRVIPMPVVVIYPRIERNKRGRDSRLKEKIRCKGIPDRVIVLHKI
ncbi:hypothetical protein G6F62_014615 [Rhizopus arrhizus]|nr:hypothetical protein G6F22_020422 [Rhizopus arrhizus]KAG0774394.1 hypothetical protein G6F21_014166 [Rhizopus arrhizus]KAG0819893.1 hypothetical protein G6F19_012546 [Rhizopus arrhizus]KAG0848715.1 hypothetical protein G6F15_014233 [Rhizopus arrhizus]KAG0869744.1 hypothetical protein G6F34_014168 [Rhizopus arrhizus]